MFQAIQRGIERSLGEVLLHLPAGI
jgi:hypothetical protein